MPFAGVPAATPGSHLLRCRPGGLCPVGGIFSKCTALPFLGTGDWRLDSVGFNVNGIQLGIMPSFLSKILGDQWIQARV